MSLFLFTFWIEWKKLETRTKSQILFIYIFTLKMFPWQPNFCCYLGQIYKDSTAERCGRLQIGDQIIAVNGEDVKSLKHKEIVKLIKSSRAVVSLRLIHQGSWSFNENKNIYIWYNNCWWENYPLKTK